MNENLVGKNVSHNKRKIKKAHIEISTAPYGTLPRKSKYTGKIVNQKGAFGKRP